VAKGRNLDIVTEVELIKPFKKWRKDLKRVALAYHLAELIDRLTAEEVKSKQVFELLTNSFKRLELSDDLDKLKESFEIKLLEELGFWPRDKSTDEIDLQAYIEKLIEKRLNSSKIFKEING
jgi:DNA repair protein RecO (recombination protein O)